MCSVAARRYPGYVADQLMAARDSQPTPVSITATVFDFKLVT
jgi:hypothetical protein